MLYLVWVMTVYLMHIHVGFYLIINWNECSLKKMKKNVSQVAQKPINWEFKRFSLLEEKNLHSIYKCCLILLADCSKHYQHATLFIC